MELQLIMELWPVMLQFATFFSELPSPLKVSIAEVVMTVTSVGLALYTDITVTPIMYKDCPFQTPFSEVLRAKGFTALDHGWLGRKPPHSKFRSNVRASSTSVERIPKNERDIPNNCYPMTLLSPMFWRNELLFTSPAPEFFVARELHGHFGCLRRRRSLP